VVAPCSFYVVILDWYVNKSVQAKDLLPNYKCR